MGDGVNGEKSRERKRSMEEEERHGGGEHFREGGRKINVVGG